MKPDEKYMSQSNLEDNDIKFVPPAFMNENRLASVFSNSNNNYNLDLFPSETGLPELCYYSQDLDDSINRSFNVADDTMITNFDILKNLDIDLNETEDLKRSDCNEDVNKIYSKIEKRHPGIFATLYVYRIPRPIARVIIKRLIKLTLEYSKRDDD